MSDLISRQAVIDILSQYPFEKVANCISIIEELPSAQIEIIRRRNCKWKQGAECVRFADVRPFPDDYCSRAERREG